MQTLLRFQADHCAGAQTAFAPPEVLPATLPNPMPPASGEEQGAPELAGAGESDVNQDWLGMRIGDAQAAERSDAGVQAAGQRRIASYPVLLEVDDKDGSRDPASDPVMRGEQRHVSSSGCAEVSGITEAAGHPPVGASVAEAAGNDMDALQAAGRSSSTPQHSSMGGPTQSLPPLVGSPARGPFSELQRSAAAAGRPEQSVELIPARASEESHGAHAGHERSSAGALMGLAVDDSMPEVVQDVAGISDMEGIGPLRVCGAEAHSRRQQDYYAATVAVDVLSFLYVAINYQV